MHPELFIPAQRGADPDGGDTPRMWCTPARAALRHFRTTLCFAKGQAFAKCLAEERRWPSCCSASCQQRRTPRGGQTDAVKKGEPWVR